MTKRSQASPLSEPWRFPWPAEELEAVASCPVCRGTTRLPLHAALVDNTFRTSPGSWSMWQCVSCGSGYLDPRPTPDSIHRAYSSYYTHHSATAVNGAASARPGAHLRRALVNGYLRWRFGVVREPISRWGPLAAALVPVRRSAMDRDFRHLPRLPRNGGKLLDVGCGDGGFLALASECGWEVTGLEPDPLAAAQAARGGARIVEGGLDQLDGQAGVFDVITLSHVIEHLHDPLKALRACHRLLKPGGNLWLETPNIDSPGHRRFGRNWRGLEAPRHLALFSWQSLFDAVSQTGFVDATRLKVPSSRRWIFERSMALSRGNWPDEGATLNSLLRWQACAGHLHEMVDRGACEYLTLGARRPP